ncbi:MAG: hypothetical protein KDA78_08780, partial [Planctomycetaceae bacterium]|nr:hypothetical protein [Planctomycetaceae bacterium]
IAAYSLYFFSFLTRSLSPELADLTWRALTLLGLISNAAILNLQILVFTFVYKISEADSSS